MTDLIQSTSIIILGISSIITTFNISLIQKRRRNESEPTE